jgi:iron complex transport system ATP-binding protein
MRTLDFQSPTLRRGGFQLAIGVIAPSPGRVTVLIGPNGGGKTTALRLAAGLLMPDAGSVLIDGEPVHALSAALGRIARPADAQRVERALHRVGLAALADRPYHSLSGGQQQRVAVARALAQHEPGGVLLLDEAFAAVDPPEAAAIVRAVREEAAAGATVLAATHDMAVASAIADDVWCIVAGQTRAFGPASDLLTAAALPALLGVAIAEASGANGRIAVADYRAILPTQAP